MLRSNPTVRAILTLSAIAAAVLVIAGCGGSEEQTTSESPTADKSVSIVTKDELFATPDEVGHDVYWAGEEDGKSYELTIISDGRTYVRYLPEGVPAADPTSGYTTVGTYQVDDAEKALKRAADDAGAELKKTDDGGSYFVSPEAPTSVYMVQDDSDLQVEVYDPDPERAEELVKSGQVEPIPVS